MSDQVRRQLEDEAVGPLGEEVLLEEQLDAVGQRLQQPEGPGPVGPMRLCMSVITLRSNQIINMTETSSARRRPATLIDDDERARPVRRRRRTAGRREASSRRHSDSSRTSFTSASASMSRAAPALAGAGVRRRLKSMATDPLGNAGVGGHRAAERRRWASAPGPGRRPRAQPVELVGVGPQHRGRHQRGQRRATPSTDRAARRRGAAGDEAQRVVVGGRATGGVTPRRSAGEQRAARRARRGRSAGAGPSPPAARRGAARPGAPPTRRRGWPWGRWARRAGTRRHRPSGTTMPSWRGADRRTAGVRPP